MEDAEATPPEQKTVPARPSQDHDGGGDLSQGEIPTLVLQIAGSCATERCVHRMGQLLCIRVYTDSVWVIFSNDAVYNVLAAAVDL